MEIEREKTAYLIVKLKEYIGKIRELGAVCPLCDTLNEDALNYRRVGYLAGLSACAATLADELDAEVTTLDEDDELYEDPHNADDEEQWWVEKSNNIFANCKKTKTE